MTQRSSPLCFSTHDSRICISVTPLTDIPLSTQVGISNFIPSAVSNAFGGGGGVPSRQAAIIYGSNAETAGEVLAAQQNQRERYLELGRVQGRREGYNQCATQFGHPQI